MKIAFCIILYIAGVILAGSHYYKWCKTKSISKTVYDTDWFFILPLSIFFPITYLLGLLMIIIEKIGGKLCKDH